MTTTAASLTNLPLDALLALRDTAGENIDELSSLAAQGLLTDDDTDFLECELERLAACAAEIIRRRTA